MKHENLQRACIAAFPHLGDFQSPYVSCSAYEGDWREAFLDGNRGNRCTVLDWKMEGVAGADGGDGEPDDDPDEVSDGGGTQDVR